MKVIAITSLLALTQANEAYNSTSPATAYGLGFTDQLGLNATQLQDAEDCYADGQRFTEDIQNVIVAAQQQDGHEMAGALIDLISSVDNTMNGACATYKEDLLGLFSQNANGTDLKAVAGENFNVYPTQVIQQVALWIQALVDGDNYTAGKTEAYILQILFGLETPEVLPFPDISSSNYVPLDFKTYVPQLLQGVYPTIGLTNQTVIDQITTCFLNVYDFGSDIMANNHDGDLSSKIQAASELVEKLAKTVDTCTPIVEYEWAVDKKLFKIFWESPLLNIAKVYFNIAKNLPEIVQKTEISNFDILIGNYTEAGVLQGEIMNIYVDGVYNLTDVFNSIY